MTDTLLLVAAVTRPSVLFLWLTLIGSTLATLFPDIVVEQGFFAESFIDRGAVRLIAVPLILVSAFLLTDYHYQWTKGLI